MFKKIINIDITLQNHIPRLDQRGVCLKDIVENVDLVKGILVNKVKLVIQVLILQMDGGCR